ncbi:MAG: glycine zipper family protein [Desulfobacteraceae bacterium]|nr:glycine zipper family protein [Nitrospiraceae bacterium]MDA8162900.1 glycine zipper family protein [Desulfobacteraceae bacterium]
MRRFVIIMLVISFLGLQLASCASMSGTEKGATTGAVAGGVLGAIFGDTKGAILGAFAGAIIGAVAGNYYDKKMASRAEAAKRYHYTAREEKIEIDDSLVVPQKTTPGSKVEARVQYTVLAPSETQKLRITETRTLVSGKERIQLAKREVVRAQGTYLSTMRFTMPKDIATGDYTLITTVSDGKQIRTAKSDLKIASVSPTVFMPQPVQFKGVIIEPIRIFEPSPTDCKLPSCIPGCRLQVKAVNTTES